MTKTIFNIGKWYTIVWLAIGTAGNFMDWLSYSNGDAIIAVLMAIPTLVWLFSLKLTTEKQEEIEISVKS